MAPLRSLALFAVVCVVGCANPLVPSDAVSGARPTLDQAEDAARTYVFAVQLYQVGGDGRVPAGHALLQMVRSSDGAPALAALLEGGVTNLNVGDPDSEGFFQMRVGTWRSGDYAGYPDPSGNFVKFLGTALVPESVAAQIIEMPAALSVEGFDAGGVLLVEGTASRGDDDPRR